jgi:integrase
MTEEKHKEG